jgi:hypothetical protein
MFIPETGSEKNCLEALVIPDPDLDFLPIPDPGPRVKKAPDPGSATLNLSVK